MKSKKKFIKHREKLRYEIEELRRQELEAAEDFICGYGSPGNHYIDRIEEIEKRLRLEDDLFSVSLTQKGKVKITSPYLLEEVEGQPEYPYIFFGKGKNPYLIIDVDHCTFYRPVLSEKRAKKYRLKLTPENKVELKEAATAF